MQSHVLSGESELHIARRTFCCSFQFVLIKQSHPLLYHFCLKWSYRFNSVSQQYQLACLELVFPRLFVPTCVHLFLDVLAGTTTLSLRQRCGTLQMMRTNAVLSSWIFSVGTVFHTECKWFTATWPDVPADDFDVLCKHGGACVSPPYYRCRFMFAE